MVTRDDEYLRNNTITPGAYEPTVVDIHQEMPGGKVDRLQSIHLQWIFIFSCAASRLLNDHSMRTTMNQKSTIHSITHHQGGFHV